MDVKLVRDIAVCCVQKGKGIKRTTNKEHHIAKLIAHWILSPNCLESAVSVMLFGHSEGDVLAVCVWGGEMNTSHKERRKKVPQLRDEIGEKTVSIQFQQQKSR